MKTNLHAARTDPLSRRTASNNLRVLIADDHALVRAGTRGLLMNIEGGEVVPEAADGSEAPRMISEVKADLVLLDLSMPGTNGFDVLEKSRKEFPDMPVIVITLHEACEYTMRALSLGAAGYLPKRVACTELEQAIEAVRQGETYVSREISVQMRLDIDKSALPSHQAESSCLHRRMKFRRDARCDV